MIHQLAQVIAKVLHLNAMQQPEEALDEIQRCSKQLLGMDLRLLTTLSDEEFIRLLSLGDRFDVEKCVAAAELLRLAGTVKDLQRDEPAAYRCTTTSLSLFLELLFRETETLPSEYYEQVDELARRLSSYDLPLNLQKKLFRYYSVVGSYAAAEDLLFDIVEQEEGFVPEGIRFYEGLLRKSDKALVSGNLPRDEVHAGLAELLKRTQ
jgi:hypothetical protein